MTQLLMRSVIVTAIALFAVTTHVFGQEKNKENQPTEDVIRVYTDVVQTDVMVFDKQGRFANGLKREDFASGKA